MVPDYSIALEETYGDGPAIVMLGVAQGTYHPIDAGRSMGAPTPAPDGGPQPEERWKMPAAFRAAIEDGKVAEWRVYADNEPMRERMRKSR